MMIYTNKSLCTPDVLKNLGQRFRDYRMAMRMTRHDVSIASGVGMTTLYKFETGQMSDVSFRTLLLLLRAIGLHDNWEQLLPKLPESPYLYRDYDTKTQRVRHPNKKL